MFDPLEDNFYVYNSGIINFLFTFKIAGLISRLNFSGVV